MGISTDIMNRFPDDVNSVVVKKHADLYGQNAIEVEVGLRIGKTVTGKFTTEPLPGFGGVEFSNKKDAAGLMISKIQAVLEGKAE